MTYLLSNKNIIFIRFFNPITNKIIKFHNFNSSIIFLYKKEISTYEKIHKKKITLPIKTEAYEDLTLKESIKSKSKTKITENINQQTSNLNDRNNLFFSEKNYESQNLNEQFNKFDKLFNHTVGIIMKNGKKTKAQKQLQNALIYIKQKINADPYFVLSKAIKTVSPLMKLVFIKKGTKSIKVPVPLNEHQRHRKAIIWILEASNKQHILFSKKKNNYIN
ncbi:hypothetical protein PNEG_03005 [Pneumocystis murina B123]|uniref:Small ribosomal subunit protein uS7 domain-containing protein n=1 Tax=Pneumocystis murina (strain B123) TaxID=1069680 RepID=M7PDI5_PNEMU|nr:hypothetical protein PNEG_03005 [Pneumocystis murina B123]EMR08524.1 hypothetical protein PNEG_03005 [Pneumocystis murina B123]